MPDARDLTQLLVEADDIAASAGQRPTSAHLLLAIWATPCPAQILLGERGLSSAQVLDAMPPGAEPSEDPEAAWELVARTREIAAGLGSEAGTLHLLMAISRSPDSLAYTLLERCGLPLAALRNTILSWFTGGKIPKHYELPPASVAAASTARSSGGMASRSPAPRAAEPRPRAKGKSTGHAPIVLQPWELIPDPASLDQRQPDPPFHEASQEALEEGVAQGRTQPDRAGGQGQEAELGSSMYPDPRHPDEAARVHRPSVFPMQTVSPPPSFERRRMPRSPTSIEQFAPLELDPDLYPLLYSFGRNLTLAAALGRLDPVIGRDHEVDELVDILGKRRGNNPVLVGEAGVGKTAIVEGVAQRLLELDGSPKRLLIELDMASLTAGTALRGAFSERLGGIKEEVRKAQGRILVFIDELHTVVGAGSTGDGPQDAANELKTALARGEFPCIGATTHDEYRRFIEPDPALERRFTPVQVPEPSVDEAHQILRGIAPRYEAHHQICYQDEALAAAARLSARYIRDRQLPDKAIQVMDLAGSRSRRAGAREVDVQAVAEVVARIAKLPIERLVTEDADRLLRLEEELSAKVVGHEEVIEKLASALRRNHAGFSTSRPVGSFLFLGPTGVGKTELAKAVAEVLFGTTDALIRLDMSELSEPHGVARLIGAPPGYVGHGEGGQLTEAVRRRPAAVVLLDEIEKAHRDVQLLLLQVLDEGRLTDARGRIVDFRHSLVILTSNLGAEIFASSRSGAPMGFGAAVNRREAGEGIDDRERKEKGERALELAREQLPLELWNRIDDRCLFYPLRKVEVARIARLLLDDSARRLRDERQIGLSVEEEVIEHLMASGGFDPVLGARPMRQRIQHALEAPLAESILRGSVRPGESIEAFLEQGEIRFRTVAALAELGASTQ